ncbi:MAG: helix-turn-helix domain-containing protein [Clostridiales bacterium]|nr:helix-turn-helix domain-containing protein [Clostridiales bacterium]
MKEQIDAVQRMQDYIEKHLLEEITLADLAIAAMFSPWYAYRLFKQYTELTPADYIRRLRLSRSALILRDTKCKIADLAFQFGFGSVDGYQRAFFREFGCNPSDYAANPIPIYLFTPYGVQDKENRKEFKDMETVKSVYIQMITKPERKVLIKRGIQAEDYFDYCKEVGCDVWGLLMSMRSISGEPVCLWLPNQYIVKGTSKYVQGVEVAVDYDGEIPEGFDVIQLPAAKYMMFQGEPFEECDYCQAIMQVQEAIKKYDPSVVGYEWDSKNPKIQLEPRGYRGYIEMWPVTERKNK